MPYLHSRLLCISFLAAIQITQACHGVTTVDLISSMCDLWDNGTYTCSFDYKLELRLNDLQKKACLRMQHENETVGEMEIEFLHIERTGMKVNRGYTRNVRRGYVYKLRCPAMGSCSGEKCKAVNETTALPELDEWNNYTGFTYCLDYSSGLSNGCKWFTSTCLFYRTYVEEADSTLYELAHVTAWHDKAVFNISWKLRNQSEWTTERASMRVGFDWMFANFSIRVDQLQAVQHRYLYNEYIFNETHAAVLEFGFQPDVDCYRNSTSIKDCLNLVDTCYCYPIAQHITCRCMAKNLTQIMETRFGGLPKNETEFELLYRNNTLVFETKVGSAMVTVATRGQTIRFQRIKHQGDCDVKNATVSGCYNCAAGADVAVYCESRSSALVVEINCPISQPIIIECTNASHFRRRFNTAEVNETCESVCGQNRQHIILRGQLESVSEAFYSIDGQQVQIRGLEGRATGGFALFDGLALPWLNDAWSTIQKYWRNVVYILVGVAVIALLMYSGLFLVTLQFFFYLVRIVLLLITLPLRGLLKALNRRLRDVTQRLQQDPASFKSNNKKKGGTLLSTRSTDL